MKFEDLDRRAQDRIQVRYHRLVSALFRLACDLPPKERDEFLASICEGDDALRTDVESLLTFDGR